MAHNKQLADARNISQENRDAIDEMHILLEKLLDAYTLDIHYEEAESLVKSANKTLSDLWKFEYDERYDQWVPRLKQKAFELTWNHRTFRCNLSGDKYTITLDDCFEGNYIQIGKSAVDLGRFKSYHRFVGSIQEIPTIS